MGKENLLFLHKQLVFELQVLAFLLGDLLKAVCVKLADERTKLCVFEELGEDLSLKAVGVNNEKGLSIITPAYHILEVIVTQEFERLSYKRGGGARHDRETSYERSVRRSGLGRQTTNQSRHGIWVFCFIAPIRSISDAYKKDPNLENATDHFIQF
jgi:hypothetical protein